MDNTWTTHDGQTSLSALKKVWHYTNFITNNMARKSVPVDAQNLDFVTLFLKGSMCWKKGLREVFPKLCASWFLKLNKFESSSSLKTVS